MTRLLLTLFLVGTLLNTEAQRRKKTSSAPAKSVLSETSFSGLKFREVGPALMSGRISDFAVNPDNPNEYYVATASGGVWKTMNSGNTYNPIFDSQGSYSIGVVTMDPSNKNVIWVGTGENNNQRSVAYGDGIYKSNDGGSSWEHMGLKNSEHIGSIVVDPNNSNIVYVAAIGPLWSKGGERGVYKTTDGGKNWSRILNVDEHTGINEIHMDPRDPTILYATAFQRRRHVFTYLAGGPGSGIYKTTDAGASWKKINKGLPKVDMGRIGMAISPADPEIIYAIVEAQQGKGGTFVSTNRGASWEKRGSYATSGNYYQEIIADPVDANKLYAMNTWMGVSTDGGRNFNIVGENSKHVDNHCLWINPSNTKHLLAGCDGGIYETWDNGKNWHFKPNLPLTQFYKVAVDNSEPFYYIYGGTQDNSTYGGPSRTVSHNGINNFDWFITHGGDGFESQVDPNNTDIVYSQSQYGVLVRYDKKSGEEKGIQPKERKDENEYRWNWDAPLAVSWHHPTRIYFAANKLFKSDDRGDSWEVLGDDLTRQIDRNKLKVMDRIWGVDTDKHRSTSPYGTIVAFSESPKNENLLIVGTDDGLIQITEDAGKTWRKVENIPGVPTNTYVNAVYASKHNENVIYAAFNNHKNGDFKPYMYKSSNKGVSWTKISNNLPERGSTYSIEEDHIDQNLIFVGTEFGVFFSSNGGAEWKQLNGGLPTIAVRDIAIQARENDLVLGTFGRGFYVLDDYSSLRNVQSTLSNDATLHSVRDGLLFEYAYPMGLPGKAFLGDDFYQGKNLGSEVIFTYYLKEGLKSRKDIRQKGEKEAAKAGRDVYNPSYDDLKAEQNESKPSLVFTVKNSTGDVIRKLSSSPKKGMNRINWDLRGLPKNPVNLSKSSFYNPWADTNTGTMVAPGAYTVTMTSIVDGVETQLAEPVSFNLKALNNTTLPTSDRDALVAFQNKVTDLRGRVKSVQRAISEMNNEVKHMEAAILVTPKSQGELLAGLNAINVQIRTISSKLNGDRVASKLGIGRPPSVSSRLSGLAYEQSTSTSAPTKTHLDQYEIAAEEFEPLYKEAKQLLEVKLIEFKKQLRASGAPYTPGNLTFLD